MPAQAGGGIGGLIVVFQIDDEARGGEVAGRRAAWLVLPDRALALKQEAVPRQRDKLARCAPVVAVIGLVPAGQRDQRGMLEIIVPQRIETIPAHLGGTRQPRGLSLVFGRDKGRAPLARGLAYRAADRGKE